MLKYFINKIRFETLKKCCELGAIKKKEAIKVFNILKYGKLTCELCKLPIRRNRNAKYHLSFDHIIPLAEGGSDKFENLRIAHIYCNNTRKHKIKKIK